MFENRSKKSHKKKTSEARHIDFEFEFSRQNVKRDNFDYFQTLSVFEINFNQNILNKKRENNWEVFFSKNLALFFHCKHGQIFDFDAARLLLLPLQNMIMRRSKS